MHCNLKPTPPRASSSNSLSIYKADNAPDCRACEISTPFTGVKSPKCGLNIRFRPLFSTYYLTLAPNTNLNNGIADLRIVDLRNRNSEPVSNSRPKSQTFFDRPRFETEQLFWNTKQYWTAELNKRKWHKIHKIYIIKITEIIVWLIIRGFVVRHDLLNAYRQQTQTEKAMPKYHINAFWLSFSSPA